MNSKKTTTFVGKILVLVVTLVALQVSGFANPRRFSDQDETNVRHAIQNYVKAWLSNDADAVMATLTGDIVLQPHHGDDPVIGSAAVRAWWFPEGPAAIITAFSVETRAVTGHDSLAYAWGRSFVAWDYEGKSLSNEGNQLSVLKKGKDGIWRIAHQIWNDPVTEVD